MENSNTELAFHLEEVSRHYKNEKQIFRAKAYQKAAEQIKNHPSSITCGQEAMKLKNIGKGIAETIDTFLKKGVVDRLQNIDKPKEEIINLFQKVHGIGPKKAKDLYDMGFRTIQSLSERPKDSKLTKAQKIGLKWYHDIDQPIPREEIDRFFDYFTKILEEKWEITGSYRRGAEKSGDLDLLIQNSGRTINQIIEKIDILVDKLVLGSTKYMGIIKIDDKHPGRRIDIRLVEEDSYPYALLYFTGSKSYNIILRNKAIEKGWKLNEYTMINEFGQKLPATSEKDIVTLLDLPYLLPKER